MMSWSRSPLLTSTQRFGVEVDERMFGERRFLPLLDLDGGVVGPELTLGPNVLVSAFTISSFFPSSSPAALHALRNSASSRQSKTATIFCSDS